MIVAAGWCVSVATLAVIAITSARAEAERARVSRPVPHHRTCTRVRLLRIDTVDELTSRRAG